MRALATAFAAGLLFALGLALSGMTQPARVLGFLDVAGRWDPSLLFVMGGAVAAGWLAYPRVLARRAPLLDGAFHLPTQRSVDGRLLVGSVLFGAGWGLSGYCPGPALMALATGSRGALVFGAAMASGMALFEVVERRGRSRRERGSDAASAVDAAPVASPREAR